jgi:hypothetical protein
MMARSGESEDPLHRVGEQFPGEHAARAAIPGALRGHGGNKARTAAPGVGRAAPYRMLRGLSGDAQQLGRAGKLPDPPELVCGSFTSSLDQAQQRQLMLRFPRVARSLPK